MNEGQNLNNGGSGLGAAGGFDAFQNGGDVSGGTSGEFGVGGIGTQGPIIGNEGGDIVLGSGSDSNSGGKSKKGLVIALIIVVVLAVVAVGAFVMWKSGAFGGGNTENDNRSPINNEMAEFHKVLDANWEEVLGLTSFAKYVYGGNASVIDFMVTDNGDLMNLLESGLSGLNNIKARMDNGPVITGSVYEIDLGANYVGLQSTIDIDYGYYERFINLTSAIIQVTKGDAVVAGSYDSAFLDLTTQVANYYEAMRELSRRYSDSGCPNVELEACNILQGEIVNFQATYANDGGLIALVYKNNVGEIDFDSDASMMKYMTNLYVGTKNEK